MEKKLIILLIVMFVLITGVFLAFNFLPQNIIPQKSHTAQEFHIKTIKSKIDYNKNGVDDYTDLLLGARAYIESKPKYKDAYYQGGYPPDGEGVCTDVIWKSFKNSGYNLKDMVDKDIKDNPKAYTTITKPDPNIDFRRVKNLNIFFSRNATSLTLDMKDVAAWQPGDIVVFSRHIAMVSDKRNKSGRPYIIHNAGRPVEEDRLNWGKIVGHYRWKD